MISRRYRTVMAVVATFVLVLIGTAAIEACSVKLDPRIVMSGPNVVYEDEENTWTCELIDFSLGSASKIINLLNPPEDIAPVLFPTNFKNCPFDMNGEVSGAEYRFSLRNPDSAWGREQLKDRKIKEWLDLPGRFPHSSGVDREIDGVKLTGDADGSECAVYYQIVEGENLIESVEIIKEQWVDTTMWETKASAVKWNMDFNNLGYSLTEERIERDFMQAQSYQRGDSGTVQGQSGTTVQSFVYDTPSEPEEYQIKVTIGTEMTMTGTWQWYELKRTRKFTRATNPSSGREEIFVWPESAAAAINKKLETFMLKNGLMGNEDLSPAERQMMISQYRDMIDAYMMAQTTILTKIGDISQDEIQIAVDNSIDEFIQTGKISSGNIGTESGPFTIDIVGEVVKESGGPNSSVKPGLIKVMVRDKTPPMAFHFKDSQILYGTTGDLISEWNDKRKDSEFTALTNNPIQGNPPIVPENPEFVTARVIENNPCIDNFTLSFYYVKQVLDYEPVTGLHCRKKGFDHSASCDCFPVYRERFEWVKAAEVTAEDLDGDIVMKEKYDFNGDPVDGDTGEGGETDPAYCVITWKIPLTVFEEPLSSHFATTSIEYTDPWDFTHTGWGDGGRLKYMVHMAHEAEIEDAQLEPVDLDDLGKGTMDWPDIYVDAIFEDLDGHPGNMLSNTYKITMDKNSKGIITVEGLAFPDKVWIHYEEIPPTTSYGKLFEAPANWQEIVSEPPALAGFSNRGAATGNSLAKLDVEPPYMAVAKLDQPFENDSLKIQMPDFTVPEDFRKGDYPGDTFFQDYNITTRYFGRFGVIKVFDDDRPSLRLNISDNSFLKQTFSFGHIWLSDFKREAFQEARKTRDLASTDSNTDTLDTFKSYIGEDIPLRPYPENNEDDFEFLEFNAGDAKNGYKDQGEMITNGKFNPWFFALYNRPRYGLFEPVDNKLYGYWIPEDLRLQFDCDMMRKGIKACDNINTYLVDAENPGGIQTKIDPLTDMYETLVLKDGDQKGHEHHGVNNYNFRDINFGDDCPKHLERECSVELTVTDLAPEEVKGPLSRRLKVWFYVTGTDIRTYTIELDQRFRNE